MDQKLCFNIIAGVEMIDEELFLLHDDFSLITFLSVNMVE